VSAAAESSASNERAISIAWPVALAITIAMGVGIPMLASVAALAVGRALRYPLTNGFNLPYLYVQHGIQLLLALAAIGIVRRWVVLTTACTGRVAKLTFELRFYGAPPSR
jgi:hypothetical protein